MFLYGPHAEVEIFGAYGPSVGSWNEPVIYPLRNRSRNVNLNLNLIINAWYSGGKSNQAYPFYIGSENLEAKEEKKRVH